MYQPLLAHIDPTGYIIQSGTSFAAILWPVSQHLLWDGTTNGLCKGYHSNPL